MWSLVDVSLAVSAGDLFDKKTDGRRNIGKALQLYTALTAGPSNRWQIRADFQFMEAHSQRH